MTKLEYEPFLISDKTRVIGMNLSYILLLKMYAPKIKIRYIISFLYLDAFSFKEANIKFKLLINPSLELLLESAYLFFDI
jgi:hypothetical protein